MSDSLQGPETETWRRRFEAFERWAAKERSRRLVVPAPDAYESAEFWDADWRDPLPLFVRRRVVAHLVEIHDAWRAQLAGLDARDCYLGIWIFDPVLAESQVVLAGSERARDYVQRHDPAQRSAPPAHYEGHPYDLSRFEWTHQVERTVEALSDSERSLHEALFRRAVSVEERDGERYLTFEHHAWFARLAQPFAR